MMINKALVLGRSVGIFLVLVRWRRSNSNISDCYCHVKFRRSWSESGDRFYAKKIFNLKNRANMIIWSFQIGRNSKLFVNDHGFPRSHTSARLRSNESLKADAFARRVCAVELLNLLQRYQRRADISRTSICHLDLYWDRFAQTIGTSRHTHYYYQWLRSTKPPAEDLLQINFTRRPIDKRLMLTPIIVTSDGERFFRRQVKRPRDVEIRLYFVSNLPSFALETVSNEWIQWKSLNNKKWPNFHL